MKMQTIPENEKNFLCSAINLAKTYDLSDQQTVMNFAKSISAMIVTFAPTFHEILSSVSQGDNAHVNVISGLPTFYNETGNNINLARTLALSTAFAVGQPFQYMQQNDGRLVADIRPTAGLQETQSSGGRVKFGWHTDDAFFVPEVRTRWIMLWGYWNPERTCTKIALLNDVLAKLDTHTFGVLLQKRFSIRIPITIGGAIDKWTKPISLIKTNNNQEYEIAVPTFDVIPAQDDDKEASSAIDCLIEAANSSEEIFCIEDGTAVIFDNNKCLHARDTINGDRHIFRIYIRQSLDELRKQSKADSNVFDIKSLQCYA